MLPCLQNPALPNREREVGFPRGTAETYEHEHLLFLLNLAFSWILAVDTVERSAGPVTAFQVFIV